MFQFFSRIRTYVESELNAALDKAEDPVKMLDQFMRDMAEDIRRRNGCRQTIGKRKNAEKESGRC